MNTIYRVFLYSSDVNRLTFESDHSTREDAEAVVADWCRDDAEEEFERGMWRIQERLNGHLRGSYKAYAHAYPHQRRSERNKRPEGETIEQFNERSMAQQIDMQRRSKQLINNERFPTRESAQLAVDKAIDNFAMELNPSLYGRIQRQQRAAGIHERFISDLIPFGFNVYQRDAGPVFEYAADSTLEELRAIRFPEGGFKGKSRESVFAVESGSLRVTDPCYDLGVGCAHTIDKVENGGWFAHTQEYREEQSSYSKERWGKTLEEFAKPDGESVNSDLLEKLEVLIDDEADEEKRAEHRARIQRMIEWSNSNKLREFSDSYGNPDDWRGRIAYLHIRHESVSKPSITLEGFEQMGFNIGVDSGQAGFFDLSKFEVVAADKDHKDSPEHEDFYEACGQKTLGQESWGTVQGMGAVSSSGYGDGGYPLFIKRNDHGQIVEARIVYISEVDEEDDAEEE